ncbi:MAG: hypothetical protein Q8R01_01640, partial [Ramlibacter sp.]|nr:hypothetical protein [Ramlibacter sp.]
MRDCLSSDEIDAVLRPLLGANYVDALAFYRFRTHRASLEELGSALRATNAHWLVAPVHVRHHWCLALLEFDASRALAATVVDSAPSAITRTDLQRLFRRAGIPLKSIVSAGRQRAGSNECGVFVVRTALRIAHASTPTRAQPPPADSGEVSLAHWRRALHSHTAVWNLFVEETTREAAPRQHTASPEAAQAQWRRNWPYPPRKHELTGGAAADDGLLAHVMQQSSEHEAEAAAHEKCYMLVASLLASFVWHRMLPVDAHSLEVRSDVLGFAPGHHDAAEALEALGVPVTLFGPGRRRGPARLCSELVGDVAAVQAPIGVALPATFGEYRFCVGALFLGDVDESGARRGHYALARALHPRLALALYARTQAQAQVGQRQPEPPQQQQPPAAIRDAARLPRLLRLVPRQRVVQLPPEEQPDPPLAHVHEHAQQRQPAAPHPADAMSYGHLRRMARTFATGTLVRVAWSLGDDAGTWIGEIVSAGGRSIDPICRYTHELCQLCGEWRARAEELELSLPHEGVRYFAADPVDRSPPASCACAPLDDAEDDLDDDDGNAAAPAAALDPFAQDRLRDALLGFRPAAEPAPPTAPRGGVGIGWYIHRGRPPHVHSLVWKQLAATTRAAHIRWLTIIKGMPSELRGAPLGSAIIDLVLRMASSRSWRWSTVSTSLSAAASALRSLPLYTNIVQPIDLRSDVAFAAASKRAQHLARVAAPPAPNNATLPAAVLVRVVTELRDAPARLLLQLLWAFAARAGDMRQVCGTDVLVSRSSSSAVAADAAVTFRFGKGAAFWGPYTVHAQV